MPMLDMEFGLRDKNVHSERGDKKMLVNFFFVLPKIPSLTIPTVDFSLEDDLSLPANRLELELFWLLLQWFRNARLALCPPVIKSPPPVDPL